jgi:betaine-aldehyde dehydrogenase
MTIPTISNVRQAAAVAQHWIDGGWRDSARHDDSINPATGEVIGRHALAGEDEAREATAAAHRAFRETSWKSDRALRSRVLNEMAERFEAHQADLIELVSLEVGKIVPEATFEVSLAASCLRYYAALVQTEHGRASEWAPGRFSLLVREPIGVAGISVPWNAPVALLLRSLAPALAAGCTTVVKMPGKAALLTARISEVISEVTSLPRGVVNILMGEREVLSYLVTSPDVPTISFTGSTEVGRAISQSGAARLKRFGLELGGKTPLLVFDDADLDAALPKLEKAVTVFAGQFCMTGSRLLVQSGVADRVRQQLGQRLARVKVGPASDPTSDMGPMIDKTNVARVDRMVEEALAAGARAIVRGGPIADGPLARGAFYRPTLLEVTSSLLPIVQGGGLRPGAHDAGLRHRGGGGRAGERQRLRVGGQCLVARRRSAAARRSRAAGRHRLGERLGPDAGRVRGGRLQTERPGTPAWTGCAGRLPRIQAHRASTRRHGVHLARPAHQAAGDRYLDPMDASAVGPLPPAASSSQPVGAGDGKHMTGNGRIHHDTTSLHDGAPR